MFLYSISIILDLTTSCSVSKETVLILLQYLLSLVLLHAFFTLHLRTWLPVENNLQLHTF